MLCFRGRGYRNPLSNEEAIDEFQKLSGTQLDPQIVQAFVELAKANDMVEDHEMVF